MVKDITLGQYFPGTSVVHRLDPRTKLILTLVYIVALFLHRSFYAYGLLLVCLASIIAVSGVSPKTIFHGYRPLLVILILTSILNLFYGTGEPLVEFWIFTITANGIINAAMLTVRILMLVTGTFLLTYTTSPIALTDGLEQLLNPLKKLRLPIHELAMMMSLALRFIPTILEETDKIMNAQKARGADFETGSVFRRARALIPLLIPLFVSAFRRAYELATAMECRCYHGGEGRTRMRVLKYGRADVEALLLGAVVLTAIILLKVYGI